MAADPPYSDDAEEPAEPDRWEEADRAWERKWAEDPLEDEASEDVEDGEALAPPSEAYRPHKTTAGGTTRAYGEGMRAAGSHIGLGIHIGLTMAFFAGVGIAVDRRLGTEPWGVILGAALGMVGIMVVVMRIANETNGTKR